MVNGIHGTNSSPPTPPPPSKATHMCKLKGCKIVPLVSVPSRVLLPALSIQRYLRASVMFPATGYSVWQTAGA